MENTLENKKIEIGQLSLGYLDTTRKWTMFFAILGFVVIGILLILGLVAGSFLTSFTSKMPGMGGMEGMEGASAAGGIASIFVFIIILIFAVIYFFPLFYLFRFSRHTKNAVANLDAQELELGLKNLKSYWRYIGIFTIIVLAFYLIVLIIAGGSLAMLSGIKG
jgi:heme/copper-type cytochrome/quinol oxidase subunit 2